MANKFTRYINSNYYGPKGVVGNFRHAERIFVDNYYRLAPRTKFLYYVVFAGADREISLLVKTSDLPKYSFEMTTKNAYNRTKHVYKMMKYEPLNFTFHDDNEGLVNQMWHSYYNWYNSDPRNSQLNHPVSLLSQRGSYGMGFGVNKNFFRRISLYTLSRQRFNGYELLAPRIKSWTHSTLDYTAIEPAENQMTIEYEGVVYSTGTVNYGHPDGFASLAYDVIPSPNVVGGGATPGPIIGTAGSIRSGMSSVFGDVTQKTPILRRQSFLEEAITAVNQYTRLNTFYENEYKDIIEDNFLMPTGVDTANIVGGVIGAQFPKVTSPLVTLGTVAATVAVNKLLQLPINENSFPQSSGNESTPDVQGS